MIKIQANAITWGNYCSKLFQSYGVMLLGQPCCEQFVNIVESQWKV